MGLGMLLIKDDETGTRRLEEWWRDARKRGRRS